MPDSLEQSLSKLKSPRGTKYAIAAIKAVFANWGPEQQRAFDKLYADRNTDERLLISRISIRLADLSIRDFPPETQLQIAEHTPQLFTRLIPEKVQRPRTHQLDKRAVRKWLMHVKKMGLPAFSRHKVRRIAEIMNEHDD